MPITRNTDQGDTSLEEYYLQLMNEDNEQTRQIGKQMFGFTELINKTFTETQLWGLTSLYRLVIQSSDDFTSPWQKNHLASPLCSGVILLKKSSL